PLTLTLCAGFSFGCASPLSLPMRNSPGGTQAMPAGEFTPSPTMTCGAPGAACTPARHCQPATPATSSAAAVAPRTSTRLVERISRRAALAEVILDDGRVQSIGQAIEYAVDLEVVDAGQAPGVRDAPPFVEIATIDDAIQIAVARALRLRRKNGIQLRLETFVDFLDLGRGRRQKIAIRRVEQGLGHGLIDLEELFDRAPLDRVGFRNVLARAVAHQFVALIAHRGGIFGQNVQQRTPGPVERAIDVGADLVADAAVVDDGTAGAGVIPRPPPLTLVVLANALGGGNLGAGRADHAGAVAAAIGLDIEAGHGEVDIADAGLFRVGQIGQHGRGIDGVGVFGLHVDAGD